MTINGPYNDSLMTFCMNRGQADFYLIKMDMHIFFRFFKDIFDLQ